MAVRKSELRAAGQELGLHETRCFDYPDGGLHALDADVLAGLAIDLINEIEPDVVVTFGPDGFSGHPDHIAVGAVVTRACHARRSDASIRLFHCHMPQNRMLLRDRLAAWVVELNSRFKGTAEFVRALSVFSRGPRRRPRRRHVPVVLRSRADWLRGPRRADATPPDTVAVLGRSDRPQSHHLYRHQRLRWPQDKGDGRAPLAIPDRPDDVPRPHPARDVRRRILHPGPARARTRDVAIRRVTRARLGTRRIRRSCRPKPPAEHDHQVLTARQAPIGRLGGVQQPRAGQRPTRRQAAHPVVAPTRSGIVLLSA